jgi:hypothetical protein
MGTSIVQVSVVELRVQGLCSPLLVLIGLSLDQSYMKATRKLAGHVIYVGRGGLGWHPRGSVEGEACTMGERVKDQLTLKTSRVLLYKRVSFLHNGRNYFSNNTKYTNLGK